MSRLKEVFGIREDDLFGGPDATKTRNIKKGGAFGSERDIDPDPRRQTSNIPQNTKRWMYGDFSKDIRRAITNAKLGDDPELAAAITGLAEVMAMKTLEHYDEDVRDNSIIGDELEKISKSFKELLDVYSEAETELEALKGGDDDEDKPVRKARSSTSPRSMGMRRMA